MKKSDCRLDAYTKQIGGEEIAELKLKAFLNQYPAKSLPAYTVIYGEGDNISNGNEVHLQRRRGTKQNCRHLFSVQISDMTDVVIEKCFADRDDAKKCLYRCIDALPVEWAHIFYINDNASLSFVGSYNADRPAGKQFWFESWEGEAMNYEQYCPPPDELGKSERKSIAMEIKRDKPVISQEAALAIRDKIDKVRRDARKQRQLSTDYYLRVACAIVAEAGGFEDRTDWTRILKNDLTSEYAKDYDDPHFATAF